MNVSNMLPHQLPQPGYRVPMLGQGQTRPEAQHQAQQAAVSQAVQQMSMGIFSRIAARTINGGDADEARLQQVARDSMTAARCYFEAMGVIERQPPKPQYTPKPEGTEGRPEASQETRQADSQAPEARE